MLDKMNRLITEKSMWADTAEAQCWAKGISYEDYAYYVVHALHAKPLDEIAFKEFCKVIDDFYVRDRSDGN